MSLRKRKPSPFVKASERAALGFWQREKGRDPIRRPKRVAHRDRRGLAKLRDGVAGEVTLRNPYPNPLQGQVEWNADALQVGFAHRESDASFSGDLLRLGFPRECEAVTSDRTPGRTAGGTVPGVRYACREGRDRTVFEIAIPISRLKTGSVRADRQIVLSLPFPVPDGEPAAPEPAQPAPNTFAYEVRYGGGALVPAHFVELVLEAEKRAQ